MTKLGQPAIFRQALGKNLQALRVAGFDIWKPFSSSCTVEQGLADIKDVSTYSLALGGCENVKTVGGGQWVHARMIKTGSPINVFLLTSLVDTYVKCGSVAEARQVFDKMPERMTVSWNVMIAGYGQHGYGEEALKLFCQMRCENKKPDMFTFTSVMRACSILANPSEGKQVHACFIKTGFEINVFVGSALVDMYVKQGTVENSRKVLDKMTTRDVVVWTAVVVGYAHSGYGEEALKVFSQMQSDYVKPNGYTFASVFSVCASLQALERGQQVHAYVVKAGIESDVCAGTALVSMYSKCGLIEDARKVFEKMRERSLVSWTAMITAYAQNGHGEGAFKLFYQLQQAGLKPDPFSFASTLQACASIATLGQGKRIHAHIVKSRLETNSYVGCALLDMYAKCGSIEDARKVFNRITIRDIVLWNSMIAGYAHNGLGKEALQLFERMQRTGLKPNHITYLGVLSACSHVGLVDKGRHYFDCMNREHGITPTAAHFSCLVDLLGRAGHLDEAERCINEMPFKSNALMWRTLLGACRVYGSLELAKRAAERVVQIEPEDDATYVLLSNIYAAAGRWHDVRYVRNMMKDRGVKKKPGCSWIEIKDGVHKFVAGDSSHLRTIEISAKLDRLTRQIEKAGYMPDTDFAMHELKE